MTALDIIITLKKANYRFTEANKFCERIKAMRDDERQEIVYELTQFFRRKAHPDVQMPLQHLLEGLTGAYYEEVA